MTLLQNLLVPLSGNRPKKITNGVKSRGLAILKVQPGQNWVKKFKRIMLGMFPSGLEMN